MKQIFLVLLLSCAGAIAAYAADAQPPSEARQVAAVAVTKPSLDHHAATVAKPGLELQTLNRLSPMPVADTNPWQFVTCVSSHHDCKHHAANHGYHHHIVTQNQHQCHHHPHLACYGRN